MLICVRVFMSLRKFLIENQLGLAAICVMSLYLLSWPIRDVKETKEPDKSKAIGSRDMGKREEKENVEWKEGDSSVAAAQLQRQCKRTSFIFALFASILCFFALLCLCPILLLSLSPSFFPSLIFPFSTFAAVAVEQWQKLLLRLFALRFPHLSADADDDVVIAPSPSLSLLHLLLCSPLLWNISENCTNFFTFELFH